MDRHFNVTVYVFDDKNEKFLFLKHRKLQKWVPPGGHIDGGELPDEAALREVWEETGLRVSLYGEHFPTENDQTRPFGIQRNIIKENEHEHLDLIYLALVSSDEQLTENHGETLGIGWFTMAEIEQLDTFTAQKQWCRKFSALDL